MNYFSPKYSYNSELDVDIDEMENLMEQRVRNVIGEIFCVILVDEIMKTGEFGHEFANHVGSSVYVWMDRKLCKTVLFSSLD